MMIPSPRAFVPSLPQSVDDIVMRAISDVAARFQDAEEMAVAIDAALDADSPKARAASETDSSYAVDRDGPPVLIGAALVADSPTMIEPVVTAAVVESPGAQPQTGTTEGMATCSAPGPSAARNAAAAAQVTHQALPGRVVASPRRGWSIAAAALLGVLGGGAAVWAVQHDQESQVSDSVAPVGAAEVDMQPELPRRGDGSLSATDRGAPVTPDREVAPQKEPASDPPASPKRPTSKRSPALLSAVVPRTTTPAAPISGPIPAPGTNFEQVMGRLAADVRACAETSPGGASGRPTSLDVHVRFDPANGSLDRVRVMKLGTSDPLASCVERLVRAAAPPAGGNPNRIFTFSLEK